MINIIFFWVLVLISFWCGLVTGIDFILPKAKLDHPEAESTWFSPIFSFWERCGLWLVLLHVVASTERGVLGRGEAIQRIVIRHCEHRARDFVGGAKQSPVQRLNFRTGDCFTPFLIPSLAFAMTVRREEGLLHATSFSTAGVRNDENVSR